MGILQTGNTYDKQSFSQNHARKIWREIRRQWPAGGKVSNVSDWTSKGKIPAGTPCKYSVDATTGLKEIKCYTDAQIKASETAQGEIAAPGIDSLGINGYTDRDTPILGSSTQATATAVRDGDIYEYMFDSDVLAALKKNTLCPLVVFVQ